MISSEKLIKFSFLLEQERYNVQIIPILQQIKYERYWNKIRVRICQTGVYIVQLGLGAEH